jgi:hypothetical protein
MLEWKTLYGLLKDGASLVTRLEAVLLLLSVFGAYIVIDLFVNHRVVSVESWVIGSFSVAMLLIAAVISRRRSIGDEWKFFVAAMFVSFALMLSLGAPALAYAYPAVALIIGVVLYVGGSRDPRPNA